MITLKASRCFAALLLLTLFAISAFSQTTTQYDRATPPQHSAGISSLGSYVSTELGTVNLSNGSLNFKIPLGSVGGRGFSIPIALNYSSKVWSASMDTDANQAQVEQPVAYADYDRGAEMAGFWDFIGAGWTIGGVPMLMDRRVQIQKITGGPCNGGYGYLLTKLTLKMPDGGEVEFRDDLYDGAPLPASNCGATAASRGTRWHATDGSGMIFINDVDNGVASYPVPNLSGTVITRDGTRYRFTGSGCTSITDRNGNKITIEYFTPAEVRYTDQLGRITSIKQNVPDPDNPSITLKILVTLPGYQGASRYYKIKRGIMNANYRSGINPTLPVITGDWDPLSHYEDWPTGTTKLFIKSYSRYAYQIDELDVLTEVVLPDNRSLSFRYNQFGEVAEVTLPTGGKIQYDYSYKSELPSGNSPSWQTGTNGAGGGILTDVREIDRAVVERRTYPDGVTLEGKWSYIYGPQAVGGTNHPCTQVQARSNTNALLMDQRHFFLSAMQYTEAPGSGNHDGTHYALWSTGIEWRTKTRDLTGSVLAASEQDWTQRAAVSWSTYQQEQPSNDNRVNQTRRYLENGMMAKTETTFDQYNNPLEVREYDFDQSLKRRSTTSYLTWNNGLNYATDDSIHMPSLPVTTTVFNAAGTQIAQTVSEYDVYSNDGNRAPLTDYASVSQHDSNYGVAKTTRGNVTRSGQWLNTNGTFIYSYPRFDKLGNVVSTKDPNGNVTTLNFADDFGPGQNPGTPSQNPSTPTYAFVTLITSPPPTPGAPVHTARNQYDYSTGLSTGFRDRNNVVTQTIYNDPFDRPTQMKAALGTGVETHTATYYAPATVFGITLARNDVLTASDLNTLDDASLRSWTVTDGFGSTIENWTRDPQGDVKVVTVYDALGRGKQKSNPFRPATESAVYTTSGYDLGGRITSVTTPDSSIISTSYVGNTVTVSDQAGKARKSVTDALGRLTDVYEDPNGLNYQTTYAYDVLDNLTTATQGTQTPRTFVFDSLKRLRSASNPESGTISYEYDNNSNLSQKTDARGIVTTYVYDALNRAKTILYRINGQPDPNTGDVEFLYDNATNGKGRLWLTYRWGAKPSHTAVGLYDALGRVTQLHQLFGDGQGGWLPAYTINRTYNRAGLVTSQSYPSGRTVTYNYDTAGRLADKDAQNLAFTGNLGDGVLRTYSRGISYVSSGALKQEQFGTTTPVYNKLFYNSRQQLAEILTSTTGGDSSWNRGKILNQYSLQCSGAGCNATDNNGNLRKQEVYIPANDQVSSWTSWYQQYDYDSLNRLKRVHEYTGNPALDWQQEFNYDRWGNRTIHQTNTWGTNIPKPNFGIDAANNNRLTAPAGYSMSYDNAGNVTSDTYSGGSSRTYDAENKMTASQDTLGVWSYYTYNADGQRVRRKINNVETWQIYGIDGELVAEYPASGAVASPQKEYGYRNGQLLVTAEPAVGGAQNVSWTNAVGVSVSGNNLTKTASNDWYNARASSNQSINSGNGYVEFTASETTTNRMLGLGEFATGYYTYSNIRYAIYLAGSVLYTDEYGSLTNVGSYATGDTLRVAIENGAVKYYKNGALLRTSTLAPTYPLYVNVAMYSGGSTLNGAVIDNGSGGGSSAQIRWLVTDHLGTPRIVFDATGNLASVSRHDYLPFGEELLAGQGLRSTSLGYVGNDGIRQRFTQKERDVETGLDYFLVRYYSSTQGRFTSPDEFTGGPEELYHFADDAAANPTFYSDLRRPQSLNKYQYGYNNPLRWIDPDGHEPDDDPQKKKKEDIDVVVIKTVDPRITGFDVKLIDKVPNTGEVPVGGEFEIKYKYVINEPTDGSKPEDAGSIAPITPKGTFTESNQVGLVNSTVKVDREKEAVVVEKTERYVVNERRESKPGATAAINYKIVVKDPNTGKVVERRSTEGRGNKYVPVRNVPKEPRK